MNALVICVICRKVDIDLSFKHLKGYHFHKQNSIVYRAS